MLSTRVEQRTDFDKLVLEVWTNGSVTPEDVVAFGAKILKNYYSELVDFDREEVEIEEETPGETFRENSHVNRSISDLELNVRAVNCLLNSNIETVGQLVQKTEAEMMKMKNFGKKSLQEIKTVLASLGLTLGMKLNEDQFLEKPTSAEKAEAEKNGESANPDNETSEA